MAGNAGAGVPTLGGRGRRITGGGDRRVPVVMTFLKNIIWMQRRHAPDDAGRSLIVSEPAALIPDRALRMP